MQGLSNPPAHGRRGALKGAAVLALGLAAAGCAVTSAERIFNAHYFSYSPGEFRSMAAAGAPVEIFGSPPGGATAEEVVAALRMPAHLASTPPRLAESPGQGARLVFAFGGGGAVNGEALCAGNPASGALPDRLDVAGAFCRGSRLMTQAQLSFDAPVGPSDPRFTSAMRRLIATLGPRTDPNRDRNSGDRILLR